MSAIVCRLTPDLIGLCVWTALPRCVQRLHLAESVKALVPGVVVQHDALQLVRHAHGIVSIQHLMSGDEESLVARTIGSRSVVAGVRPTALRSRLGAQ